MDFSGILLAGGKSTRFGINKIKIEFEGIPLIADQIIKMGFFCKEIMVSSSRENSDYIGRVLEKMEQYQKTLLTDKDIKQRQKEVIRIVIDDEESRPDGRRIGPLAGIYSGLKSAKNKKCLVLASDMPFISYKVLDLLIRTSKKTGKDAVIIRNLKGIEALCGIYSKKYITRMRKNIDKGINKISEVLVGPNVEWIDSMRLRKEKVDIYNFFNINTRDDIKSFEYIRKKGISGVDSEQLNKASRNIWEAFFYRGRGIDNS